MHLGSNYAGAQLELKSNVDQGEWRAACVAPCDISIPVLGVLARVTAPGMTSSNAFRIEPGVGTAHVRVDGGSAQARSFGILALGVGIPTSIGGMSLYGYGRFSEQDAMQVTGAVVLGTGLLLVVTSLPLLLIGSTTVRDGRGSAIAKTLRAGVVTF